MAKFVSMEPVSVTSQSVPPHNGGESASCFNTPGGALIPGGLSAGQLLKPLAMQPRRRYMELGLTTLLSSCVASTSLQKSLIGIRENSLVDRYNASLLPGLSRTTLT
ncbi:hypothetical protein GCM10022627_36030 [Haloarcula argentinensis]|uniref:Uncharacterized protein n=2 Tax=Haloarcula TaxID=2237 RepID=A0A830EQ29_9EURY|nr:hypothetical protein GCM10009067_38600 [Haloarcula sebkhae]GGM51510.1 hypothetical protein GCM10009006_35840 [Haloarcula argentinensis]